MSHESNSVKSCDVNKETLEIKSLEVMKSITSESNPVKSDHETKETLEEPTPKLWVDIISGNRMSSN